MSASTWALSASAGVVALAMAALHVPATDAAPPNVVVERYASGQVKREASYRKGQLDGVVRGWFENGALEYERTYRAGREEGTHRGWYDTGARRFEYEYRAGVSEGEQRQWYPSGQPYTVFHHAQGHELGQQQMWNPDGSVRSNYVVRDGRRYGLLGAMGCTGRGEAGEGASR